MIKYENECCFCASDGYPCVGKLCPFLQVPHYYCDECNHEDKLYFYDSQQLCLQCIEQKLEVVLG